MLTTTLRDIFKTYNIPVSMLYNRNICYIHIDTDIEIAFRE